MNKELKKILSVDDDEDIRTIISMALEIGGYEVFTCSSGEQAVVSSLAFQPDLILLDVMMPGLDGPATLKKLLSTPETSKIPIVFMTAKSQSFEIVELKQMGAFDAITKPFDPMTLPRVINDIWERYVKT